MEQYKKEFIDFMLESKVLKFGDFTLKSGRKSPFFMNAGGYVISKATGHGRTFIAAFMVYPFQVRYCRLSPSFFWDYMEE